MDVKGLIVKSPWIEKILSGEKTWEIRGRKTNIRGTVALIKSGTGMIYGTVDVLDCKELTIEEYRDKQEFHRIPHDMFPSLPYPKTYAWIFSNPVIFDNPKPYAHPQGAVIWVNLPDN